MIGTRTSAMLAIRRMPPKMITPMITASATPLI